MNVVLSEEAAMAGFALYVSGDLVLRNELSGLLVEEPIKFDAGVAAMDQAREIEERDFPVGGPFGV